jgi:hypothetical protein
MRKILFLVALLATAATHAQLQIGAFTGVSDYNGDLLDKPYRFSHAAVGLTGGYRFTERFTLRAGITSGKLEGADRVSGARGFSKRNLNFQSSLRECSLVGELNFFSLENIRWTPFVLTGVALYHYNPYTFDQQHQKFYLRPLSTEGQGLPQYPGRKPYALTRLALPLGSGLKYVVGERLQVAMQIVLRITNNDYLDDVSTTYVNEADLLAAKGQKAVELSYRSDEWPGGDPAYPQKGKRRGQSGKLIYTDFYYFSGLHFTYDIRNGSRGYAGAGIAHKRYGCAKVW